MQVQLKITIESVDWNRFSIHLLCNFTITILRIDLLTPASCHLVNTLASCENDKTLKEPFEKRRHLGAVF